MAHTVNLYMDQGSDFHYEVLLNNQDLVGIDLTGYDVYSQFRKSFQSSAYYAFNCSIVGPASLGEISLDLPGSVSIDIPAGRYLYDIEIRNSLNNVQIRIIEGILLLSPCITRPTIT